MSSGLLFFAESELPNVSALPTADGKCKRRENACSLGSFNASHKFR